MDLTGDQRWDAWNKFKPKRQDLQRTWTKKVNAPLNQYGIVGTRLGDEETGRMAPGLYYLEVTAKGADPAREVLVVSPYNIIFKQAETQGFVWVTDLKTGQVVADLPVRIYDSDGNLVADGSTDQDGIFQGTFERVDPWNGMYVLTGDESLVDDRFGAAGEQVERRHQPVGLQRQRPAHRPGLQWLSLHRSPDLPTGPEGVLQGHRPPR